MEFGATMMNKELSSKKWFTTKPTHKTGYNIG